MQRRLVQHELIFKDEVQRSRRHCPLPATHCSSGWAGVEVRRLRVALRGLHLLFRSDALLRPYPFICARDEQGLYGKRSPVGDRRPRKIRGPPFIGPRSAVN